MSPQGSNNNNGCTCNLDFLLLHLGRNQTAAVRLIRLFLENLPQLCERMHDAIEGDDAAALKDALHDIRSSCVLFAGHRCVDLAREFEIALQQDAVQPLTGREARNAQADLLTECLQCMAVELQAYLNSLGK